MLWLLQFLRTSLDHSITGNAIYRQQNSNKVKELGLRVV